jgi:hypothetical protein
MISMRRFGFLGFLVLLLLVGVVGAVGYNLGVSAGAADAALAEGATVVYTAGGGFSPFALIAGFLLVVLAIGFIGRTLAGPRMGMGPGYWGYRGRGARREWHGEDVPEPFRPMLERWHRGAHGASAPGGAPDPGRPPMPGGPAGASQPPR